MELKNYQKKVLDDLALYMKHLNETSDLNKAWEDYWFDHDVYVGVGVQPPYVNNIPGVPHICVKSGTGSGKTFMAVASIKTIFDNLPMNKIRLVVWLVPSDSILTQTINNLQNPEHPYRQRLNQDFGGKVEVYTKEELLNGQNFSPNTVLEQLTVCVMSFASLRIDLNKKDVRKAYQENGNLKRFAEFFDDDSALLANTPDTALMQVLRQMYPVAIVDESHNATSKLSVDMLKNLNASFIFDLTATPRKDSNVFSYVDAREVKKENMVKLPVVVYKRAGRQSIFEDAIQLRGKLEMMAANSENNGGDYIRPIVLFQAQPKIKEESITFNYIKQVLIRMGINENEIAIKTSDINELKGWDLLSKDCPIRYIITVNALKEGWDCSFAYILASLANKSSTVDVEQILGRILRQPYAHKHEYPLLNTSYVLTSSDDFHNTLESVVKGLNSAGFSKDDYRVGMDKETQDAFVAAPVKPIQEHFEQQSIEDNFEDINLEQAKENIEKAASQEFITPSVDEIIKTAEKQTQEFEKQIEQQPLEGLFAPELEDAIHKSNIRSQFVDSVANLKIPQFFVEGEPDLFGPKDSLLEPIALSEGFVLKDQDSKISFTLATGNMFKVDISDEDAVPRYVQMSKRESQYIHEMMSKLPADAKKNQTARRITEIINRNPQYEFNDVKEYVARVIDDMSKDELTAMESAAEACAKKIQDKLDALEKQYRKNHFFEMMATDEILVEPSWTLPSFITPPRTTSSIAKSLYDEEDANMNNFEKEVITAVASLENVVWWHRNIDRKGFRINGFINHYPDFIVMTTSGRCVIIETKGDYLANEDSTNKIQLGDRWQSKLDTTKFRYYMVFPSDSNIEHGAYSFDNFIEIMKKL
ncbi:MAG: DEAD/DEAH box helicase family protein [Erysipelotrichaceae bacterium]|nr:DEAD/DEAH box helicase family protein [Erysipelotrichaceae bacterium]